MAASKRISITQAISYLSYAFILIGGINLILSLISGKFGSGLLPILLGLIFYYLSKNVSYESKKGHMILLIVISSVCFLFVITFFAVLSSSPWSNKLYSHILLSLMLIYTMVKLLRSFIYQYVNTSRK